MLPIVLYRASGLALLLGTALYFMGTLLNTVLYAGNDPHQYLTPMYAVVTLATLLGIMLLVLGLPGVAVRQAPRAGWLGFIGFTLASLGGFLYSGALVIGLLVLPWLAQVAPALASNFGSSAAFVFFLFAVLLQAVGGILLGVATMRAKILPRLAGLLLLIACALNLVVFFTSGITSAIVGIVVAVLLALAFGWMGYALLLESRFATAQAVPPSAQVAG
jgi:hypothetical protein